MNRGCGGGCQTLSTPPGKLPQRVAARGPAPLLSQGRQSCPSGHHLHEPRTVRRSTTGRKAHQEPCSIYDSKPHHEARQSNRMDSSRAGMAVAQAVQVARAQAMSTPVVWAVTAAAAMTAAAAAAVMIPGVAAVAAVAAVGQLTDSCFCATPPAGTALTRQPCTFRLAGAALHQRSSGITWAGNLCQCTE